MKIFSVFCLLLPLAAAAQSTIDATQKYAWAANTGWINFRPSATDGVVAGEAFCSGYAYSGNLGWIHFGDGSPANGHTYGNADAADYGVNHDGEGNLSGYAYSANTGWIHFGWASASDPDRPRINLLTGAFAGYAYGANTGWINLGAGYLETDSLSAPDTDGDGMADAWERARFRSLASAGPGTNQDGDPATDVQEYLAGTSPGDPSDYLKIVSQVKTSSGVTLGAATTKASRLYSVWSVTPLPTVSTAVWTQISPAPVLGNGGALTMPVTHADDAQRYYRVEARRPLP
ncbi:MAG: hypothetical protein U1F77_20050 [Kiritimatiellia bacterium]